MLEGAVRDRCFLQLLGTIPKPISKTSQAEYLSKLFLLVSTAFYRLFRNAITNPNLSNGARAYQVPS